MRIGKYTNELSCEYEMQDEFAKWLKTKYNIAFVAEKHVPEVKRRADFLLVKWFQGNLGKKSSFQLVNIEAKCTDYSCMMKQLKDHAQYCDYSFAFIPDYAPTPMWFKGMMNKLGYGLIIYNEKNKSITEVYEAHHNKPQLKELRKKLINDIQIQGTKSNEGLYF